jgi:hypothetical protein
MRDYLNNTAMSAARAPGLNAAIRMLEVQLAGLENESERSRVATELVGLRAEKALSDEDAAVVKDAEDVAELTF